MTTKTRGLIARLEKEIRQVEWRVNNTCWRCLPRKTLRRKFYKWIASEGAYSPGRMIEGGKGKWKRARIVRPRLSQDRRFVREQPYNLTPRQLYWRKRGPRRYSTLHYRGLHRRLYIFEAKGLPQFRQGYSELGDAQKFWEDVNDGNEVFLLNEWRKRLEYLKRRKHSLERISDHAGRREMARECAQCSKYMFYRRGFRRCFGGSILDLEDVPVPVLRVARLMVELDDLIKRRQHNREGKTSK